MMKQLPKKLGGGNARSIGQAATVATQVRTAQDFEAIFKALFNADKLVVQRAANVMGRVVKANPEYLKPYKKELLKLLMMDTINHLRWYLPLWISYVKLSPKEVGIAWDELTKLAHDKKGSRIVRTNAINGLFNLLQYNEELAQDFHQTVNEIKRENIPSINARVRNLLK